MTRFRGSGDVSETAEEETQGRISLRDSNME